MGCQTSFDIDHFDQGGTLNAMVTDQTYIYMCNLGGYIFKTTLTGTLVYAIDYLDTCYSLVLLPSTS